MSLFHAKDAAESVKVNHTERKAVKEAQHFVTSPFGQRLIEENKQLRSALSRIGALERRMDDTEAWQAEARPRIESALIAPALPTVPNVQCRECRESYPNYPAYWPGGFHGSTDPVCAYCKSGHEYE